MKVRIPPRLDDRSFEQLRTEAIARLQAACPAWTDLSASDPGIALVEVFAYLTEVMLYRLNRVPEKLYNAFLRLLGTTQEPPAAATVQLQFSRSGPGSGEIAIPQGTRVTAAGGMSFTTAAPALLRAPSISVLAYHGEEVESELVGKGTGVAGLEVSVRRPPIVAPMGDALELIVGVEATSAEIPDGARAIEVAGKTFRVWDEVGSFSAGDPNACVYVADRLRGVIRFPPALRVHDDGGTLTAEGTRLGAVPAPGREIRVSYRTGGGASGNVAPGTLTTLQDRIAGLNVTNPVAASGGRDAESLDNAMQRGPIEFHRLHRAVTARDYEGVARQAGGVARARALTKSEFWSYAAPGVVQVLLVPPPGAGAPGGAVSIERLRQWQTDAELTKVQTALAQVRPVGVTVEVTWTLYKQAHVKLRVVTARQEDRVSVHARVLERLHRLINPLPATPLEEGWAYGGALRRYEVEGAVRAEPGVLYVSNIELIPDHMPDGAVAALSIDAFQRQTWYAGSGGTVYRTINAGNGWELSTVFPDQTVRAVRASPRQAGLVVAVTADATKGSHVHFSVDCGDTWTPIAATEFVINDVAWSERGGVPLLFLATDSGLYELLADGASAPVQLEVDRVATAFYAVSTAEARGIAFVAVAATGQAGVFLSRVGGATKSFTRIDPSDKAWDLRVLAVQTDNVRSFLWAGKTIYGDEGGGCVRYELLPDEPRDGWQDFGKEWKGGSCHAIGFTRSGVVVAGSHSRGVLSLDTGPDAAWELPPLDSGLPITADPTVGRLVVPVQALLVDASTKVAANDCIAVGTEKGIYRSAGPQAAYESVSDRSRFSPELRERVTLPPTWLFVSGAHEVEVVSEDQAGSDADH